MSTTLGEGDDLSERASHSESTSAAPRHPPRRFPSPPPIVTTRLPEPSTSSSSFRNAVFSSSLSNSTEGPTPPLLASSMQHFDPPHSVRDLIRPWYLTSVSAHLIPILRECARTLYQSPSSSSVSSSRSASPAFVGERASLGGGGGRVVVEEEEEGEREEENEEQEQEGNEEDVLLEGVPSPSSSLTSIPDPSYLLLYLQQFLEVWLHHPKHASLFRGDVICHFLGQLSLFLRHVAVVQVRADVERLTGEMRRLGTSVETAAERLAELKKNIGNRQSELKNASSVVTQLLSGVAAQHQQVEEEDGDDVQDPQLELLKGQARALSARAFLQAKESERIRLEDRLVQQREGLERLQEAIQTRKNLAECLSKTIDLFDQVSLSSTEKETEIRSIVETDKDVIENLVNANREILAILGCWNLVQVEGQEKFLFVQGKLGLE